MGRIFMNIIIIMSHENTNTGIKIVLTSQINQTKITFKVFIYLFIY